MREKILEIRGKENAPSPKELHSLTRSRFSVGRPEWRPRPHSCRAMYGRFIRIQTRGRRGPGYVLFIFPFARPRYKNTLYILLLLLFLLLLYNVHVYIRLYCHSKQEVSRGERVVAHRRE